MLHPFLKLCFTFVFNYEPSATFPLKCCIFTPSDFLPSCDAFSSGMMDLFVVICDFIIDKTIHDHYFWHNQKSYTFLALY